MFRAHLDRATGKIAYAPSVSFEDAKTRDAFGEAVWRAVEEKFEVPS